LHAAERATPTIGGRLATAAIERGGLSRSSLARAIELSAAASVGSTLPWEQLSRALEGGGPAVARARALALEGAGRLAEALVLFADVTRSEPTDEIAQRGIARALTTLDRHDEAISAWDRVSKLHHAVDAKLSAARAALAAGRVDAGVSRLQAIVRDAEPSAIALSAYVDLAHTLAELGRADEARAVDRALARVTDALGPIEAAASAIALRAALARAIEASDLASAHAHLEALTRTLGDADGGELAAHHASIAAVEARAMAAADPSVLRARADALRAAGQSVEAARVLVEVFAQTQDAAVLRAAIELADRSADRDARLAVFDRALALLPAGAARDAILARR
jgi:tetratricopeptide (TPR) repeat protein